MDDSILDSVKKFLSINAYEHCFDPDIVMSINTALMILHQIGVGKEPLFITDNSTIWSDLLEDAINLEAVKTYVALKVRTIFDPPVSSAVKESFEKTLTELEWRISVAVNPKENNVL